MEPAEKKPHRDKQAAPAAGRKLRFDPAHVRIPKPHHISGKDRPGDR